MNLEALQMGRVYALASGIRDAVGFLLVRCEFDIRSLSDNYFPFIVSCAYLGFLVDVVLEGGSTGSLYGGEANWVFQIRVLYPKIFREISILHPKRGLVQ